METCDVLIVGGGPAGSSCAKRLTAAGKDVIVLDKSQFPRDKVCAGWITPAVAEALAIDLDDYRKGRVCQDIRAFYTGVMQGPYLHHQYDHTVSYGIRRCEFDHYLLLRSGARLKLNEPLKHLQHTDDVWIINNSIRASMLVGAGGHFCPVARFLGANVGRSERSVAAQEIEFEMTPQQAANCPVKADTPELFFYPDLSGYGWLFRKGNFLNIGVGREDTGKISQSALDFVALFKQQSKIPGDAPEKLKGHAYLLYGHAFRKLVDDGVMLIGDAAGLAYTESGEGIRPAVESGLMAAEVILDADGDYCERNLQSYLDNIATRFGVKQTQDGWFPAQIKRALAKQVLTSRFLSRRILLDRFFLHSKEPPLPFNRAGIAPCHRG
ncbi:MAG: NAD(P)/FAD-dependent oxidoreductase [Gammaproteobacteria bacterium]|nr:NAD(P)/FAD-dependent oxidoreductase [Gammaproteobacteria bacterium]